MSLFRIGVVKEQVLGLWQKIMKNNLYMQIIVGVASVRRSPQPLCSSFFEFYLIMILFFLHHISPQNLCLRRIYCSEHPQFDVKRTFRFRFSHRDSTSLPDCRGVTTVFLLGLLYPSIRAYPKPPRIKRIRNP